MNKQSGRTSNRIEKKTVKRKISESNRVGFLKKSKKYAQGKEYNTLEGRIKIINRYLENGEIMISFLNLKNNKIIIASELDVNSMLYRYTTEIAKKAQGDVQDVSEGKYITDEVKTLREAIRELTSDIAHQRERYEAIIDQQFELIKVLQEQLKRG